MNYKFNFTPAPRELKSFGSLQPRLLKGAPTFSLANSENAPRIKTQLTAYGWMLTDGGEITVDAVKTSSDELFRDPVTGYPHGEGYRLKLHAQNKRFSAGIEYVSIRGLKYALSTLDMLLRQGGNADEKDEYRESLPEIDILDGPRFPIRALIEGYYGPPWSPSARKGLLELMAEHRMNAYFYGPKDDVFHRERWRDPYEGKSLEDLKTLISLTSENDMDFWYNIGPGLSMAYSNDEDFKMLVAKLNQVRELGVTRFGLLFDDIPEKLQHEGDKAAYPDLPHAHADIANRLFRSLKEMDTSIQLAACPTQYHGNGDEAYITALGGLLDPRIEMFWTGPEICSRQLTLADAGFLSRRINRPVLYWDNYPVNDLEMSRELHIGPYLGRDPHLYRSTIGIVANGMELPESSKIGFLTIADYLWNPEAYDAELSWNRALQTVIGTDQWEDFRIFADNNRYSCLYTTDSPDLKEALESIGFLQFQGDKAGILTVLSDVTARLSRAVKIFDRGLQNRTLQDEIGRWIENYRKGVQLLNAALEYLKEPGDAGKIALEQAQNDYSADNTYVFADVLNGLSHEILERDIN